MSECETLIYAELLIHIQQISILAALKTPASATTKAEVSPNGVQFVLYHDGEVITTDLPGKVAVKGALEIHSTKELSWRLPLASAPTTDNSTNMQNSEAPWSAKHLEEDSEFLCRSCDAVIISAGRIKTWRNLPRENWAEMMEFWHCHKPDDHSHESNGASGHGKNMDAEKSMANRGYGANTKIMARSGLALINLTTFLVTESDCTGIQTSCLGETSGYKGINCKSCNAYLGYVDDHTDGIRLYKWTLKPSSSTTLSPTLPSAPLFISSQLADTLQSQCVSHILLSSSDCKSSTASPTTNTTLSNDSPRSLALSKSGSSGEPIHPPISKTNLASSLSSSSSTSPSSGSTSTFLSLWLLTSGMRYSVSRSSAGDRQPPTPRASHLPPGMLGMKAFWKYLTQEEAVRLQGDPKVEEVLFVTDAIHELGACLRDSAASLPPGMRTYQQWNVGLLERYEG